MSEDDEQEECCSCGKEIRPGDTHGITFSNEAEVVQQLGDLCEDCAFQIQEIAQDFIQGSNGAPEYLKEVEESLKRAQTKIGTARDNLRTAQDLEPNSTEEAEIDLEGLPEEIQDELEDKDTDSIQKLLENFEVYLRATTRLGLGDIDDHVRAIGSQLGIEKYERYEAMLKTKHEDINSLARRQFKNFLDSNYTENPEKASEEGE